MRSLRVLLIILGSTVINIAVLLLCKCRNYCQNYMDTSKLRFVYICILVVVLIPDWTPDCTYMISFVHVLGFPYGNVRLVVVFNAVFVRFSFECRV